MLASSSRLCTSGTMAGVSQGESAGSRHITVVRVEHIRGAALEHLTLSEIGTAASSAACANPDAFGGPYAGRTDCADLQERRGARAQADHASQRVRLRKSEPKVSALAARERFDRPPVSIVAIAFAAQAALGAAHPLVGTPSAFVSGASPRRTATSVAQELAVRAGTSQKGGQRAETQSPESLDLVALRKTSQL